MRKYTIKWEVTDNEKCSEMRAKYWKHLQWIKRQQNKENLQRLHTGKIWREIKGIWDNWLWDDRLQTGKSAAEWEVKDG